MVQCRTGCVIAWHLLPAAAPAEGHCWYSVSLNAPILCTPSAALAGSKPAGSNPMHTILCTQSYAHCWYSVSPMLQSYARPLQHRQQMRAAVAATGYSGEVEFVPLSQVFSNEASEGDVSHQHQQQLDRLCSLVQVRFICFLKGGEWMRICVCT